MPVVLAIATSLRCRSSCAFTLGSFATFCGRCFPLLESFAWHSAGPKSFNRSRFW